MRSYWLVLLQFVLFAHLQAFDGDESLNFPDFNRENFLDISSYEYSKQLDDKWYASDNGFRLSGGSLGQDVLNTRLHFKFRTPLNAHSEFRLLSEQEAFYGAKPIRQQVELGGRPFKSWYFSLLGTPTYEKRNSDLGLALELGSRPSHYIRLVHIRHDVYFNDKNSQDDAYYDVSPTERQLEIVTAFREKYYLRFFLNHNENFLKILPTDLLGNQGEFKHEGGSADLVMDYHHTEEKIVGLRIRVFDFDKGLHTSLVNARQKFIYRSVQNYYLYPLFNKFNLTLGWRHDSLGYDTEYPDDAIESAKRYFDTNQVYGLLRHSFNNNLSFEYGLHLGQANLRENFMNRAEGKSTNRGIESKLRLSVELISLDKNNQIMFNTNWNLDDPSGKYWDGGRISFQGIF